MRDKIKHAFKKSYKKVVPKNKTTTPPAYFQMATSWADDMSSELIDSRQRYRLGFYSLLLLGLLLSITIVVLACTQQFQLVMLEHWQDGSVTEHAIHSNPTQYDSRLVQSELVKYVEARESYHPSTYVNQYALVTLMSSPTVARNFVQQQSSQNKSSPINQLGKNGSASVTIQPPIVFYDRKTKANDNQHKNIAVVNFSVTQHNSTTGNSNTTPYSATIEWTHRSAPSNPTDALLNWDGFTVTHFVVEPRNLST